VRSREENQKKIQYKYERNRLGQRITFEELCFEGFFDPTRQAEKGNINSVGWDDELSGQQVLTRYKVAN